jgi:hypothetical protein
MNASAQEFASEESKLTPILMILASVIAAGLGYAVASGVGNVYPTPPELLNLGAAPTDEERAIAMAAKLKADQANAMIMLGIVGAVWGTILSACAGWLRSVGKRTFIACLTTAAVAGGLGVVAGNVVLTYHGSISMSLFTNPDGAEQKVMMMHGLTWALIGLGLGLGCSIASTNINAKSVCVSTLVGGIMGGLAGIMFPFAIALAAPLIDASLPIPPAGMAQIIWIGLASLFVGGGLSRAA